MAFTSTGVFTPDTKQTVTPLEQLVTSAKKKTATTAPANVFAPVDGGMTPVGVAGGGGEISGGTSGTGATVSSGGTNEQATSLEQKLAEDTALAAERATAPEPPPGITPEVHYISDDPESPYYWETLGYEDATWAGLPHEMGWWQENADGTKTWVTQRDMKSVSQQLHDLQYLERPELTDLTTTGAYSGIQDLIDLWNDPNRTQADKDAAIASFEQEMGQQPGWFAQQMASMYNQQAGGIMGQQGLNQEYRDAFNRETQLELQGLQENYKMMIESMGAEGRSVAGFTKLDEISRGLSSFESQRDVTLLNTDLAMKQAEYDALVDRYSKLFEMKQISAAEYTNALQQNRINALTGYAQQISTISQQNQTEIQMYQAHAEVVYKGILADMQVSEGMMNQMQDYYEMYMAPYYAELERWSLEQQVAAQNTANALSGVGVAVGAVAGVAMLATSAICIEMNRNGYFPQEWLDLDRKFGMLVRKRRPDVYSGYARICNILIPKMRKSKWFIWVVNIFFQPWVRDMAYLMGRSKKRSWAGRFINVFGFWLCRIIGKKKGGGTYEFDQY